MKKWLPLDYSFVRIQNSLTNLVWDNKFFTIFGSKTRLVRLIYKRTKEEYKGSHFCIGSIKKIIHTKISNYSGNLLKRSATVPKNVRYSGVFVIVNTPL